MSKDYYKLLGIEKNASQDEVKRAFRKLAHQYHPDKEGGNEAKFKEINEAYQVLGNEEKRRQYDQFGATFDQQGGFGGGRGWDDFMHYARGSSNNGFGFDFGGMDLGDIFGDIFGFSSGRKRRTAGADIQVDLTIEFRDAAFGVKKEVELYKYTKCDHCHGNLAEPGSKITTCAKCGGAGQIKKVQQTFFGAFETRASCPDCYGEGKFAEKKCIRCHGEGIMKNKEKVEINVPAGIEDGSMIKFAGKGEAAPHGGSVGDLYVNIKIKKDNRYQRVGNDVLLREKISFTQAILGDRIDLSTLDGEVQLKIPAGTQPNTRFRLKGRGIPRLHSQVRGDLYVEVEVDIPKDVTRKQRKLLEDFDNN